MWLKGSHNWNKSKSRIVMSQGVIDLAVGLQLVMLNLRADDDPGYLETVYRLRNTLF
jgi:hypothetical protein